MSWNSITGYITFLGNSQVSWRTKKQDTIAYSSTEAEYRFMATTCREISWIKYLLIDLCIPHSKPLQLPCDNQTALHLVTNPIFHEHINHIELDCHLKKIQPGLISTAHYAS